MSKTTTKTTITRTPLGPLNGAEAKTLAKIEAAGGKGARVADLDMRHLGRLSRRGLIEPAGSGKVKRA